MSSIFDNPAQAQRNMMLMTVRRAFPESQRLLAAPDRELATPGVGVTWFGASFYPETAPALALVRADGALAGLVGEKLRVARVWPGGSESIYVWVDAAVSLAADVELAVARRAFLSMALLSQERLICAVAVTA